MSTKKFTDMTDLEKAEYRMAVSIGAAGEGWPGWVQDADTIMKELARLRAERDQLAGEVEALREALFEAALALPHRTFGPPDQLHQRITALLSRPIPPAVARREAEQRVIEAALALRGYFLACGTSGEVHWYGLEYRDLRKALDALSAPAPAPAGEGEMWTKR